MSADVYDLLKIAAEELIAQNTELKSKLAEAREKAERYRLEANSLMLQRDEAREAIPAGEWVAYEDHKKFHDAASRLLVAINKQLPIGCFTLISSEYYTLKNAIYGREQNDP
jgi:FtsZ-binding cell division protein ZapB